MDSAIRKGRRAENNLYEAERGSWDVFISSPGLVGVRLRQPF